MSFEDRRDVKNDNDCGQTSDDPFHMAICQAYADGITLVAGSGNDGIKVTQGQAPQAYPGGDHRRGLPGHRRGAGGPWVRVWRRHLEIADDEWASWSNRGPQVALMAVADCEQVIAKDGTIECGRHRGGHRQQLRSRGTAPGARLYDVKIFDNEGNGDLSNALRGALRLPTTARFNVANMSFEDRRDVKNDNDRGQTSDDPFHMAICQAYADGITLVAGIGQRRH